MYETQSKGRTQTKTVNPILIKAYCGQKKLPFYEYSQPESLHYIRKTFNEKKCTLVNYGMAHVYIAKLENITIFGRFNILTSDDCLIVHGLQYANYPDAIRRYLKPFLKNNSLDSLELSLSLPSQIVEEECVVLRGHENFGHWLFDYLTRMSVLEYKPELKKLKLLILETVPKRFLEFLTMLGFEQEQFIFCDQTVSVKNAWIPSSVCYRGHYTDKNPYFWPDSVLYLRSKILGSKAHLPLPLQPRKKRLYLSREESRWRRIINERALVSSLSELGFENIVMERLPIKAQLEIISQAEIIISPLGAGAGMIMFAPKNVSVVELTHEDVCGVWSRIWCDLLGQRYHPIICEKVAIQTTQETGTQEKVHADYDLLPDIQQVLSAVKQAITLNSKNLNYSQEIGKHIFNALHAQS